MKLVKKNINWLSLFLVYLFLISCENKEHQIVTKKDPLPSWNEGETKKSITQFLEDVTNKQSSNFVAIKDRIACIDNDGTLWTEHPLPNQVYYVIDKVKEMAKTDSTLEDEEPFKSLLNNDMESLMSQGMDGLVKLAIKAQTGMDENTYRNDINKWFQTAVHPVKKILIKDTKFQAMTELMVLLKQYNFTVFIVSGGSRDFMRAFVVDQYGIPEYRTIGSTFKTRFNSETHIIDRLPEIELIDDLEGKPVGIYNYIGKKPVFVAGNSDGDFQMMQYAEASGNPFLNILITHTDADREFEYNSKVDLDKATKALAACKEKKNWVEVDMKKDWKIIYSEK